MNRTFICLTNNFELSAQQIAMLYKNRWQIELFLIGCHCGTRSTNQPFNLRIENRRSQILQILGFSLLDKTPVNELLVNINTSDVKEQNYKQLSLSLF